jgi:hypothetical protein
LFYFLFWFDGDLTHFQMTLTNSDGNRGSLSISLIPFNDFKANPNFGMVRAMGVEPTTFGSGGQSDCSMREQLFSLDEAGLTEEGSGFASGRSFRSLGMSFHQSPKNYWKQREIAELSFICHYIQIVVATL